MTSITQASLSTRTRPLVATMATAVLGAWAPTQAGSGTESTPSVESSAQETARDYRVSSHSMDVRYLSPHRAIDSIEWKALDRELLKGISSLSTEAQQSLSEYNVARLATFAEYPDGWAGGEGQALSPLSLAVLDSFLQHYSHFATEPSLFLTRHGTLELAWETQEGRAINLEFLPNEIEYFVATDGEEGVIQATRSDISTLKEKLSRFNA